VTPKPNAPDLFEGPVLSAVALPTTRKEGVKPQLLYTDEPDGCREKILLIKRNVLEPAFPGDGW
jgi:Tol biopolymer transport system component